ITRTVEPIEAISELSRNGVKSRPRMASNWSSVGVKRNVGGSVEACASCLNPERNIHSTGKKNTRAAAQAVSAVALVLRIGRRRPVRRRGGRAEGGAVFDASTVSPLLSEHAREHAERERGDDDGAQDDHHAGRGGLADLEGPEGPLVDEVRQVRRRLSRPALGDQ